MNKVELNIGRENNPFKAPYKILEILSIFNLRTSEIRLENGTYKGDLEQTLVANINVFDSLRTLKKKIEKLCIIFEQECIAVVYNNKGTLIYNPSYKKNKIKFSHKYFIKF